MTLRIKVTLDPDNPYDRGLINELAGAKNKAGTLKYLATEGLKKQQTVHASATQVVQHISMTPSSRNQEAKEKPVTISNQGGADFVVIGLDDFFK